MTTAEAAVPTVPPAPATRPRDFPQLTSRMGELLVEALTTQGRIVPLPRVRQTLAALETRGLVFEHAGVYRLNHDGARVAAQLRVEQAYADYWGARTTGVLTRWLALTDADDHRWVVPAGTTVQVHPRPDAPDSLHVITPGGDHVQVERAAVAFAADGPAAALAALFAQGALSNR